MKKKQKYRLVETTNNACIPPSKRYVIEKKVRFLFWSWWSQNYLFDVDGCYEYHSKEKAENMMEILLGKKNWIDRRLLN